MEKLSLQFKRQVINRFAPEFDPSFWNDGSEYAYSITLNGVIPDFSKAFREKYKDLTPSTVAAHLRQRSSADIASDIGVSLFKVNQARDSIREIMSCLQYSSSCYSYAVDDPGPFPWGFKPQPGQISGLIKTDREPYTDAELIERVEADGAEYCGMDFQSDSDDQGYKIGLFMRKDRRDFHFIRSDNNGLWSHKMAHGPVVDRDYSEGKGRLITNPLRADFGLYAHPVGFFKIPEGGLFVGMEQEDRPHILALENE